MPRNRGLQTLRDARLDHIRRMDQFAKQDRSKEQRIRSSTDSSRTDSRPPPEPPNTEEKAAKWHISIKDLTVNQQKTESRLLYDLISHIQELGHPVDLNDLLPITQGHLLDNPQLFEAVKKNPKLTYDPVSGTLCYRPTHSLKNKNDLMRLLDGCPDGVEKNSLKDAYRQALDDVEELERQHRVVVFYNPEKQSHWVFSVGPSSLWHRVGTDIAKMWHDVQLPNHLELSAALQSYGLRPVREKVDTVLKYASSKLPGVAKRRRPSNSRRFFNTHVMGRGIDMSKDYIQSETQ